MKILTIFTGGTIGSSITDGFISPDTDKAYKLIDLFQKYNTDNTTFDIIEPYTLLSENLNGEHLRELCETVSAYSDSSYDGIIVTHGSDTLQYSAAMLALYLSDISIPVLVVASNHVLEDPTSNGLANFKAAVSFIRNDEASGVFVPYKNSDGIVYVHRGDMTLPHLPYSDDLYSVANMYYGHYNIYGEFIKNEAYDAQASYDAEMNQLLPVEDATLPDKWNSEILWIKPFPGMDYPNIPDNTKAILLDTYHSGTINSEHASLKTFLDNASSKNIKVYLTGANTDTDYESVKAWKEDIITLPQASPIGCFIRLWLFL